MHTYRGPNGLNIHYNGDFSGMAVLRYQGTEIAIPAEDVRSVVEPVLIVREIAASDPLIVGAWGVTECLYCGAEEFSHPCQHEPDCIWLRARQIVAQMERAG